MKNHVLITLLVSILGISIASAQNNTKATAKKNVVKSTITKKNSRATANKKSVKKYHASPTQKLSVKKQVAVPNAQPAAGQAKKPTHVQESKITIENPQPVNEQKEIRSNADTSNRETSYKAALGIKFLWGISLSGKYFFKSNQAIEALLRIRGYSGVGTDLSLGAHYQYHYPLKEVKGLNLYGGGGLFGGYFSFKEKFSGYGFQQDNNLYFGISAILGAEYKIQTLPLAISMDWNPVFNLTDSYGGSGFGAENGGIGVKYTF